jgi:hypothetical protein
MVCVRSAVKVGDVVTPGVSTCGASWYVELSGMLAVVKVPDAEALPHVT